MQLDEETITTLVKEVNEHVKTYLEGAKNKNYAYKVAASTNIQKIRKMINEFKKELTVEYRARKLASKKESKVIITPLIGEEVKVETNQTPNA